MFCFNKSFALGKKPCSEESESKTALLTTDFPLYTGCKVRSIVHCYRCQKPRCIYSPRQLSKTERGALEELKNNTVFACNTSLIPPIHVLQGKIFLKNLACSDDVEREYYTSPLRNPLVCYYCGTENNKPSGQLAKLLQQFRLVVPSCSGCHLAGKNTKGFYPIKKPDIDFIQNSVTSSLYKRMVRLKSL